MVKYNDDNFFLQSISLASDLNQPLMLQGHVICISHINFLDYGSCTIQSDVLQLLAIFNCGPWVMVELITTRIRYYSIYALSATEGFVTQTSI